MRYSVRSLPSTYAALDSALGARTAATIANNTTAYRGRDPETWDRGAIPTVDIVLHGTTVAVLRADESVRIRHGGYRTVTTKQRINAALGNRGRVFADRGTWYYAPAFAYDRASRVPFTSGRSPSRPMGA